MGSWSDPVVQATAFVYAGLFVVWIWLMAFGAFLVEKVWPAVKKARKR